METAHDYSDGSEFTDERLFGTINDEKDFRNWDDDSDIDGSEGGDTSDQDTRKADVIILDWVDQPSEDTISLTESVTDYPVEHGRRYHRYRAGEYLLPNDEIEQRRLDHVHRIFRLALRGRLHLAPLQDPQRIIDLGTGTGNWAIDCGELYPDAEVVGLDLSPIQPPFVPPNVRFEVDDITDTWLWEKDYFDYVHCRALVGSISDWPTFISTIFEHVAPGGYCEIQEVDVCSVRSEDDSYGPDHRYRKFNELLRNAAELAGKPMDITPLIREMMVEAGFVDVAEKIHICPLGDWHESPRLAQIGRFNKKNFKSSMETYALALFTRYLGMDEEEVRSFIEDVFVDLNEPNGRLYWTINFIYGRKPTLDEQIVQKLEEQTIER